MKMDKSRTYGRLAAIVDAYPSARFRQDGHYFDKDGNQVDADEPVSEPAIDIPQVEDIAIQIRIEPKPVSYADMHWKNLKPLVEGHGLQWTNKADAVEALIAINSLERR